MIGTAGELGVALDDRAGLVAVEARHQDVAEDQVGVVVVDLRQRVEAVFGEQHLVAALLQEDLGAAADRVAVVDDEHLQSGGIGSGWIAHQAFSSTTVCRGGHASSCQICTISKSSLRAPHSGQVQFIGTSSQAVPGGDAVFRIAGGLVVDPAADQAHPGLRLAHGSLPSLQCSQIVDTAPLEKARLCRYIRNILHVRLED